MRNGNAIKTGGMHYGRSYPQVFKTAFTSTANMPSDAFNKAAEQVKTLTGTPSNDEKLKLYALFKQATVGDNATAKPGMFDMTGKAKWQAWLDIKGKSQTDAENEYMDFVGELIGKYGIP